MFILPFTIITSLFMTASAFYTIMAYVQLVLFERMVKRDFPHASTLKTMSIENKNGFKKVGWKIARGLGVFIGTVLLQHFFLPGKL